LGLKNPLVNRHWLQLHRFQATAATDASRLPGKEEVNIKQMIPIGQYAIKIVFDDGYRSGLYDWNYLDKPGESHAEL
jgi:DUF971 family protein